MKSTNMLERLNQELKRRTYVVRIFRMPRAVCCESEHWRRDARELARSHALSQHGPSQGAQEGGLAAGSPDGGQA
jgi:transposase-like protein